MDVKPAQRELNVALKSISTNIDNVHLIHDDLIIATKTMTEQMLCDGRNQRSRFVIES